MQPRTHSCDPVRLEGLKRNHRAAVGGPLPNRIVIGRNGEHIDVTIRMVWQHANALGNGTFLSQVPSDSAYLRSMIRVRRFPGVLNRAGPRVGNVASSQRSRDQEATCCRVATPSSRVLMRFAGVLQLRDIVTKRQNHETNSDNRRPFKNGPPQRH